MVEKNLKKKKAKANRVYFDMPLGTLTHKDKRVESRQSIKSRLNKGDYDI